MEDTCADQFGGGDGPKKKKGKVDSCPKFDMPSKTKKIRADKKTKTKVKLPEAHLNMNMRDLNANPGDLNYRSGSTGSGTGDQQPRRTDNLPALEINMTKKRKFFNK